MKKNHQQNHRRLALGRTKWQDKDHIKHNRYGSAPHYLHTPYAQGKKRKIRNPFAPQILILRDAKTKTITFKSRLV